MSVMYSQEAIDAAAKKIAELIHPAREEVDPIDIEAARKILSAAVLAERKAVPIIKVPIIKVPILKVPMSGLPDGGYDDTMKYQQEQIEEAKRDLQAAVRGDDAWRHTDVPTFDDDPVNMAAPIPPVYVLSRQFLEDVFDGLEIPSDAVGQLADGFLPCLLKIVERQYHPEGATWRRGGRKGLVREIMKNTDRIHDRDWLGNIHDQDSGEDLVNYAAMYTRAVREGLDNWGFWGPPAREDEE